MKLKLFLIITIILCFQIACQTKTEYRLTKTIIKTDNPDDGVSTITYQYNQDGKLKKSFHKNTTGYYEETTYHYNENDKLKEEKIDSRYLGDYKILYKYNDEGKLIEVEYENPDTSQTIENYEYENGKKVTGERIMKSSTETIKGPIYFEYNKNGQLISKIFTGKNIKDSSDTLEITTKYEYDKFGNLIKEIKNVEDGKLITEHFYKSVK